MKYINKKTISRTALCVALGGMMFSATNLFKSSGPSSKILIASGGLKWDSSYISFVTNVIDTPQFNAWMVSNNIIGVTHDIPDPDTGACLWSFNVSKLGLSGAGYVSRKGITASDMAEIAEQQASIGRAYRRSGRGTSPELILVEVSSSGQAEVIGRLEPYLKNGRYSVQEHINRLNSFLSGDSGFIPEDNPVVKSGVRFLKSYIELKETSGMVEIPMISEDSNPSGITIGISLKQWTPPDDAISTYKNGEENKDFKILSYSIPFDNVVTNSIKMRVERGKKGRHDPDRSFKITTTNNQSIDVVIRDVD